MISYGYEETETQSLYLQTISEKKKEMQPLLYRKLDYGFHWPDCVKRYRYIQQTICKQYVIFLSSSITSETRGDEVHIINSMLVLT